MHHLERVIERFVPEIAPGFAGRLYLFDEGRGALIETCSWLGPVHSRSEFPPSACWALQRGDLHQPRGSTIDVPCDHLDPNGDVIDSICLPLIAQRTTLGLLYLEPAIGPSKPLPEISELYLKVLAENIGLAVGNLRLQDKLRQMAMADPLTGLANRRHLETVLEYRVAEAQRLNQSISCVMVDIDHFKGFNDEFGHAAGDAVLRAVGELLNHSTREKNLAFRYGGEEFLLLMPELGAGQAAQRAEEIRSKIHMLRVEHGGRELGPLTASFGAATAPEHCAFSQLVQTADAALLRAKEAGRDRVVVAAARRRDERPKRASSAESDQASEIDAPASTSVE
jgi:diguanylate cyclase (GGDEF)-like protein